jgi:hypothetical protein
MTDYSSLIDQAAQKYNVDPKLISAVIQTESSWNPAAVSKAGAIGLGQIMPATAKALGIDPTDPAQNIMGTAEVLSQNLDKFGNVPDALRAYNGGYDQANWQNPETQAYVGKVAGAYGNAQPPANSGAQMAANGASDVPLTSASSPAFSQMFPELAKSSETAAPQTAPAFSQMFPDLANPQPKAVAAAAPPGMLDQLGSGFMRGAKDVGDTLDNVVAWGDKNIPGAQALDTAANSLSSAVAGHPTGFGRTPEMNTQIEQQDAAGRANFQQQYGDSTPAQIGRIAGNVAVTAPALAVGGPALGAAADATGIGSVLSGAGNAVRSVPVIGRLLAGGAQAAGAGALAGGAAGGLASGGSGQSVGQGITQGAETGAVLGPIAATLAAGAGAVGRAVTGGTIAPTQANLADLAMNKYKIPLTAPQMSDNASTKFLSSAADTLGYTGAARNEAQQEAFTRAVGGTFGADATHLTPDVMQAAKDKLGQAFDSIAAKTTINADNQFVNDLIGVQSDAAKVLPSSEQAPINSQIDDVLSAVDGNASISGQSYQALTAKNAPLSRLSNSRDPNIAYYAQQIRSALDDAMERSLAASGQTDLATQLQQTRLQYKNMMTVAPLAAKAEASGGVLSPALLQGAVQSSFKNRAFQGAGDLGELAAIGQTFLKPTRSSGTAERYLGAEQLLEGAGGIGAMLMGHPTEGAAILARIPAQIAGGRGVSAILNSRPVAEALLRRSLNAQNPSSGFMGNILSGAGYGSVVPLAARLGGPQGN